MAPRSGLRLLAAASLTLFTHGKDVEIAALPVDAQLRDLLQTMNGHISEQDKRIEAQDREIVRLRGELAAEQASSRKLSMDSSAPADSLTGITAALDTIWLVLCGALVMLMQAGFAMVEAGACRSKNAQHILLKNLSDVCVGTLGWFFFGYTFAYRREEDNTFIGTVGFAGHHFAIPDSDNSLADGKYVPVDDIASPNAYCHWFFQWAFCSAAATIVSGGVAERVNFWGYAIYSFLMTSFIYPVLVAWTWGYGWIAGEINDVGYMDFAGSGVVHMCGGVGALAGAVFAGPRKGRFDSDEDFSPHSLPLVVLGTFLLWFGWYGFNCGSTLAMSDESAAAKASLVAMNTTTAAATGGLTVVALKFAELRKYDIGALCNGILAGLVSITAPCANVDVGTAILIGLLGGLIYFASSMLLKLLKVDDPLDAFAVHGACGGWGVMAAAFFDWGTGFTNAHGWSGFTCVTNDDGSCDDTAWSKIFAANFIEVIMVLIWSGGLSCLTFGALRISGMLKAGDEEQDQGADVTKHSPTKAYNLEGERQPPGKNTIAVVPMS